MSKVQGLRSSLWWGAAIALFLAMLGASCGDSPSKPSPSATTTFQGTVAGTGLQSGTLTVTIQTQLASAKPTGLSWPFVATLHAQSSTTASGSLHQKGGATVALTGTYDSTTRALLLSGSGYAFSGTFNSGVVTGTFTGPGGGAGTFSTRNSTAGSVTVYCGNVFGSGGQGDVTGVFNLVVSTGTGVVSGAFYVAPFSGFITGQVTGTALSITYTDPVAQQSGTATGTVQGNSVSGVSATSNPFSGTTSSCQ